MADLSKITLPNGDEYDLKDNNAIPSSEKAVANGVATLDENGLIPQSQMPGMVILSYGNNTWEDFLEAYQKNNIIYCRASSSGNPASGSQTRLAFMAYVNNATSPTEVEFQYYRSISSHSATQQGDQVYVYKLNKSSGWSVTVREAYTRVATNNGLTSTWSGGVLTASADIVSTTKLNSAATAATETAGTVYPVALDANGKLAVHVDDKSVRISSVDYEALTPAEKASDTTFFVYDESKDAPQGGNYVQADLSDTEAEYVEESTPKITNVGTVQFSVNGTWDVASLPAWTTTNVELTLNGDEELPDFDFYIVKRFNAGVFSNNVVFEGYSASSDLSSVYLSYFNNTGSAVQTGGSGIDFDLFKYA